MKAREYAFWLLVDSAKRLPKGFFARAAHDEVYIFEEFVRLYVPAFRDHLKEELLSALCYLIPRWFLSFFVFCMPESMTLALWNHVLFPFPAVENKSTKYDLALKLHQIALALIEIHSARLLSEVKLFQAALYRIPKNCDTIVQVELASHLDSRTGMEFMQNIVESVMEDSNQTRLLGLLEESPIRDEKLYHITSKKISRKNHHLRCVILIQRWFRSYLSKRKIKVERHQLSRHNLENSNPLKNFFESLSCTGENRRNSTEAGSCQFQ